MFDSSMQHPPAWIHMPLSDASEDRFTMQTVTSVLRGQKAWCRLADPSAAAPSRLCRPFPVTRLGLLESVRVDFRFVPDEELPTYYQASDVLVYPYREVTTSGAPMTGLAFRKAIVAATLPAFQEALRDRKTALLVNYGDVDALASALTRLIRDPKERERLTFAAASSANFDNSWTRIAKETRQCYTAVLQDARAETFS